MNDQNLTNNPSTQTTGEKIVSTAYKIDGWNYRAKVIKNVILGIALVVLATYVAYEGNIAMGGVLALFALILFLGAWLYWWRSKSLIKGKFYVPPENK